MLARALTIAGSDSGGGAGIQADLKTFTVFGVFGTTALTALTAQNTCGIAAVHAVPPVFVRQQIDAVATDIGIDAAKTGMLANAEIVLAVVDAVRRHRIAPLIVDPVMVTQTGTPLLDAAGCDRLRLDLLPLATLVTPNVPEAEALTGRSISSVADMRTAARRLVELGAQACLIKGGHLAAADGAAIDILDDGKEVHELSAPRIVTRHTHGTGCQLAAAITASMASGIVLFEAVRIAKRFISTAIAHGLALGQGTGPANALAWLDEDRT